LNHLTTLNGTPAATGATLFCAAQSDAAAIKILEG
jgi:hypothetical protein